MFAFAASRALRFASEHGGGRLRLGGVGGAQKPGSGVRTAGGGRLGPAGWAVGNAGLRAAASAGREDGAARAGSLVRAFVCVVLGRQGARAGREASYRPRCLDSLRSVDGGPRRGFCALAAGRGWLGLRGGLCGRGRAGFAASSAARCSLLPYRARAFAEVGSRMRRRRGPGREHGGTEGAAGDERSGRGVGRSAVRDPWTLPRTRTSIASMPLWRRTTRRHEPPPSQRAGGSRCLFLRPRVPSPLRALAPTARALRRGRALLRRCQTGW